MQVEVTFLTRRGADAIMRKSQTVTAESLRFGRGSDNEVQLPDIRVGLHAAVLAEREGGLFVQQAGDEPLRVNGESTDERDRGGPGDRIHIGPYEVIVIAPPQGADAALTVELVQPLGDALRAARRRKPHRAGAGGMEPAALVVGAVSRWSPSSGLRAAGRGLFLRPGRDLGQAGPRRSVPRQLRQPVVERRRHLQPAPLLRAELRDLPPRRLRQRIRHGLSRLPCRHRQSRRRRRGCRRPRARISPRLRCADCHEEHRGLSGMVIKADALCVDCHATLAATAPKAGVRDVAGFPAGHPAVPRDGGRRCRETALRAHAARRAPPKPVDRSNLVFSHAAHLIATGFLTPAGHKVMACADCHVPEPSGQGFQPDHLRGPVPFLPRPQIRCRPAVAGSAAWRRWRA